MMTHKHYKLHQSDPGPNDSLVDGFNSPLSRLTDRYRVSFAGRGLYEVWDNFGDAPRMIFVGSLRQVELWVQGFIVGRGSIG